MFSSKMVNFTGIWIFFALALPTHVFDPFLYTLFHYRMTSVRRLQTGGASLDSWRKGHSHDVAHEAWQRPYDTRSLTYSQALHATMCATHHGRIRHIVVEQMS